MPTYLSVKPAQKDGWVQVAYIANGIHPLSKKPVLLTMEKFQSWADYLSYLKENNSNAPLVKNHSTDPTDRLGTIMDWKFSEADGFWILPKWNSPETAEKVKDASFSVFSSPDAVSFDKKSFAHALMHVGVTDYPVLKGLRKDGQLSLLLSCDETSTEKDLGFADTTTLEKGSVTPSLPKKEESEKPKMDKIAQLLGLPATATEAELLAAVGDWKKKIDAGNTLAETQKKILGGLVKAREEKLSALPEAAQKKLKKYCTEACVLSDLGEEEPLFDIALAAFTEKADDDEVDELSEFKSGDQNFKQGSEADASKFSGQGLSLIKEMQEEAKAYAAGGQFGG